MASLKFSQFKDNECSSVELRSIVGGITRAEFHEVCKYLWDKGHYDQLAEVMKMYNSGSIQFED